jgi:hypothetical protein
VRDREERGWGGGGARVRKFVFILVFFFFKCWLIEPVRFNRFQTLETKTEPNRIFFVTF